MAQARPEVLFVCVHNAGRSRPRRDEIRTRVERLMASIDVDAS